MIETTSKSEGLTRLRKLREFEKYLRTNEGTLDQILQFMSLHTFSDRLVITAFLAIVKRDGLVCLVSKFGCDEKAFNELPQSKISLDTPVNKAIRLGTVMNCGNIDSYKFAGPGYKDKLFPNGFASSIAFPVPGFGSVILYCAKPFAMDLDAEEFLLIVGKLLSIELLRIRKLDVNLIPDKRISPPAYALTDRQWRVYEGVKEGRSNSQIAYHLGIGETLVQHELRQIMAALQVSDRGQILQSVFPD
jgi:DNA-binding CsgD family transcriptional regulator